MIDFCTSVKITNEEENFIRNSLPPEWDTKVMYYNAEKEKEIHIKINATTIEETQNWLNSFQKVTNTFYSVNSGYNSKGQRVYYKKRYHCHHNTRHKDTYDSKIRNSIKNTKCPANLIILIRKILEKYQGKKRPADPEKPCEIKIKLHHNHPLDTPDILKFKKVLPEVKEQLLQLFKEGYTASTALKQLKETIKHSTVNYQDIYNDRSKCPDYSYCYHLYLKYTNLQNSTVETDEYYLTTLFENFNKETNEISAEMAICEHGSIVCLCPPLSKRVYQLEETFKIVFVESYASGDNNGNRIFLFLTPSEVGCLPLGVIVTNSDNIEMIRIGLSLLKDMLTENIFHGSDNGPNIFITDEFLAQDSLLTSIWPKSSNYLSIFHVLQNIWHWLSNLKNNISSEDRPLLFRDFYNVLYATTENHFEVSLDLAIKAAKKYDNYLNLLTAYLGKKKFWAFYLRPNILQTDNDIIKYSESSIRFLRINMFKDNKNFEFTPMIEFIIKKFYPYFLRRLLDVSSGTIPDVFYSKMKKFPTEVVKQIRVLGPNMRLVPSQSEVEKYYIINTDLLTCTCAKADQSSICKHVQCVSMILYQKIFEDNCQQIEVREKCHLLAAGSDLPEHNSNEDPLEVGEEAVHQLEEIKNVDGHQLEEVKNVDDPQEDIHLFNLESREDELNCQIEEYKETNEETENYLQGDQKEECVKECKLIWKNITNVFEEFINVSSDDFAPVLSKLASKFDAIDSVSDLRSAFNIFDPVQPKKKRKIQQEEEEEANHIVEEEENVENIANFIIQMRDN